MTLKELVREAYSNAKAHGFHDGEPGGDDGITIEDWQSRARSIPEKLALIHSEVSEALEAYRDAPDMVCRIQYDEKGKPVGFWSELADVVIRVADLCGMLDISLEHAITQKMIYNRSRPHRHGGKAC